MVKTVTTYKVRAGNSLPIQGGAIVFTFGVERQEIELSECATGILTSEDMCLFGGDYFSANYKALPGRIDGDLIFNSTQAKKPVITQD